VRFSWLGVFFFTVTEKKFFRQQCYLALDLLDRTYQEEAARLKSIYDRKKEQWLSRQ